MITERQAYVLRSFEILNRSATRKESGIFSTNSHALFYLWRKENLVRHQKVSKYYDHDCKFWEALKTSYFDQKQTFTSTLLNSYSEKNRKNYMTPYVLESLFSTQNSLESTCA